MGRQEGLERAIFKCDKPEHAAQFATTLKELALYVDKEYKGGEDIGYIFRELTDVQVLLPPKPAPEADEFDMLIWQEKYKDKREKLRRLEESKSKAFALALGQRSPNVTNKLESQPGHKKIRETRDILGLLKSHLL